MTTEELQKIIVDKYIANLGHVIDQNADFFDAGGDSVAVEVILSELSQIVKTDLPGWLLLDNPSAVELARAIHQFVMDAQNTD